MMIVISIVIKNNDDAGDVDDYDITGDCNNDNVVITMTGIVYELRW